MGLFEVVEDNGFEPMTSFPKALGTSKRSNWHRQSAIQFIFCFSSSLFLVRKLRRSPCFQIFRILNYPIRSLRRVCRHARQMIGHSLLQIFCVSNIVFVQSPGIYNVAVVRHKKRQL